MYETYGCNTVLAIFGNSSIFTFVVQICLPFKKYDLYYICETFCEVLCVQIYVYLTTLITQGKCHFVQPIHGTQLSNCNKHCSKSRWHCPILLRVFSLHKIQVKYTFCPYRERIMRQSSWKGWRVWSMYIDGSEMRVTFFLNSTLETGGGYNPRLHSSSLNCLHLWWVWVKSILITSAPYISHQLFLRWYSPSCYICRNSFLAIQNNVLTMDD